MYFLSSPASGMMIFLCDDESENWGIIKEQCYSDTDGHKYVYCNFNDCIISSGANTPSVSLNIQSIHVT
jgi:hypothetical protein